MRVFIVQERERNSGPSAGLSVEQCFWCRGKGGKVDIIMGRMWNSITSAEEIVEQ
jgi:hypothetical protein